MGVELAMGRLVVITIGIVVFAVTLLAASGILGKTTEAALKVIGINLGEIEVDIQNLEAQLSNDDVELFWAISEGASDLIDHYKVYHIQRQDLREDQKALVSGTYSDWSSTGNPQISDNKWAFTDLVYGWHVFKLVAVSKTEEDLDSETTMVWVSHEADISCPGDPVPDDCYINYATSYEDINLCNRVSEANRDKCYKEVAVAAEKSEYCEKISGANVAVWNECFTKLAVKTGNAALCEVTLFEGVVKKAINDPERYDTPACYYQVAIKTNNAALCEKIAYYSEAAKDECKNQIV